MPWSDTTAGVTWQTWSSDSTSATADTWSAWNVRATTSATTNTITWQVWNEPYDVPGLGQVTANYRDYLARQAQQRADADAEQAARVEADAAARRLLIRELNRRQRRQFETARSFTVLSRDRRRRYRIDTGSAGNVRLLRPDGVVLASFCVHQDGTVPDADNMLAQLLLIRHDEETFLRLANVTPQFVRSGEPGVERYGLVFVAGGRQTRLRLVPPVERRAA